MLLSACVKQKLSCIIPKQTSVIQRVFWLFLPNNHHQSIANCTNFITFAACNIVDNEQS